MNRLEFKQVEALFHEAVGRDPPTRELFLADIARRHGPAVSSMVRRLLSQDASATRWTDLGLGSGPDGGPPDLEPEGTIVGRFRLVRRLGYGGHGDVYLAEQQEPVRRHVALKMVRSGGGGAAAIERFRSEQQALALMDHPNIAAVYEAGQADAGRLYFAMAYVEGEPIDAWCDRHRLPVRRRLELFLKVCRAVQHAHQKGLIHRDLKPSNILVTERDDGPEPVLIDFGIAVATAGADGADAADRVATRAAVGTPAYMSPEQAGAAPGDIDTRSDVYALGVLLYELLTGRTPLDDLVAPDAVPAAMREAIIAMRTPAPTAMLDRDVASAEEAAARRGVTAARLRRQVRGDLDAIAQKATAHGRDDRYPTIDALAADVEAALAHRPVSAGAASPVARARKFARRHRLPVAVGSVVLGALLVAVVGTSVGMVRAERAADESNTVNMFLQDFLSSSDALEKGRTVRFVEVIASGSEMAEVCFADYPRREGEVHLVFGATLVNLAMYRDAHAELERAWELLRGSAGMDDPLTLKAGNMLASLLMVLLRLDDAEALASEIADHARDRRELREAHLHAQRVLAGVLVRRGDAPAAIERLRALIPQIDADLGPLHTEAYNARLSLSSALYRTVVGRRPDPEVRAVWEERAAIMEETAALQRERYGGEDAIPVLGAELVVGRTYLDLRRLDDARAVLEPLLPRVEARVGRVHGTYCDTAIAMASLSYVLGDYEAAAEHQLAALDAARQLHAPKHPNLIGHLRDTLPYLDAAGRHDEGLAIARDLYEMVAGMLGPDSAITLDSRAWLARFCDLAGDIDEAAAHYAAMPPTPADALHEGLSGYLALFRGGHLARQGRFEEAESLLLSLAERVGGVEVGVSSVAHPDDLARMFIEVYGLWGRTEKVREYEGVVERMRGG